MQEVRAKLEMAEKENEALKTQSKQAHRELLRLEGNFSGSAKRVRACVPDSTPFMMTGEKKPLRGPITPFATNWSGQGFSSDISKRIFRQR